MDSTVIIKPKTDPEKVLLNAKSFVERVKSTKEYQAMLEYYEAAKKYKDYAFIALGIGFWIGVALAFVSERWYWADTSHKVIVWSGIVIFFGMIALQMYFKFREYGYTKECAAYIKNIEKEIKKYGLRSYDVVFSSDIMDVDSFWDSNILRVIECLKKWPEIEGASYVIVPDSITQLSGDPKYVSYHLCQYVMGKVERSIELSWTWFKKEDLDMATARPGVIDLSMLDKKFWHDQTPYYEEENSEL